jgi:uncharacterized protein YndB with AHSA1/START domain
MTKENLTPKPAETAARQHETSIEIDAPIEEVWKAITDATAMARWFAPKMTVEPGVGGFVIADWGQGIEWKTTIEIWERNRRLRLVETRDHFIGASPVAETFEPCRLIQDYYLDSTGGKTVLRLVHSGFGSGENWDIEYEGTRGGWAGCFLRMKLGLERHRNESVHNMFLTWTCQGRGYAEVLRQIESATVSPLDVRLRGQHHFCAVIPDLNGSVLNVSLQPCPTGSIAYIEALLFGPAGEKADVLESQWKTHLATLFPALAASQS